LDRVGALKAWVGWTGRRKWQMVGLWISHSGAEPPIDRDGKGTEGGNRAQRGVRRGVRIWHAQRGGESRRKKRDVRAWKPGGARGPGDPRHRREVSRAEGKHGKERGGEMLVYTDGEQCLQGRTRAGKR